jgi:hypothetical protein
MTTPILHDRLHLGELAASAAADGELEHLTEAELVHLETCADCALLVANFATRSIAIGVALQADAARVAAHPLPVAVPKQPFPLGFVVAAALLAMLGMTPTLVGRDPAASLSAIADLARAAIEVSDIPRSAGANLVLELGAALMLAALGLWIAMPRSLTRSVKGVVR